MIFHKIGDFGLATNETLLIDNKCASKEDLSGEIGTITYMAPEVKEPANDQYIYNQVGKVLISKEKKIYTFNYTT